MTVCHHKLLFHNLSLSLNFTYMVASQTSVTDLMRNEYLKIAVAREAPRDGFYKLNVEEEKELM